MSTVLSPQIESDPTRTRRVELILRQIESLPTLPAVATRLLALTTDDDSHAREVVQIIQADAALTARILSMGRRAELGIRDEACTVDRMVMLLGFDAIRNAVLSIKVVEMFNSGSRASRSDVEGGEKASGEGVELDRPGFWRHSLAVATAAEQLATAANAPDLNAGEAFVCGLLHDLGKIALDYVLPKSYGRVVELVELNQGNITEFERRIIGMDHHTAGKRLAEQWQLAHVVQDCIWLHGSPLEMLPRVAHRRMIGLITLADLIARRSHLGYSGNFSYALDPNHLVAALGLDQASVDRVAAGLHQELEQRHAALGLSAEPSHELYVRSIQQANQMLGRLNSVLDRRSRSAARQGQLLEAITAFHGGAMPGRGVEDVLCSVVQSAGSVLGRGFFATIRQSSTGPWIVSQFTEDGRATHNHIVDSPAGCPDLRSIDASQPAAINIMGIMPWIVDFMTEAPDLRQLRVLPLGCGWGTAALLLHDRPVLPPWQQLLALSNTWGAAIAAASQHDGARRLGEELADANRALAQTQDRLLQAESMARVGEMAAGAAHEMNNPLTVVSGRAQQIASWFAAGSREHQAATAIVAQAHQLSDLITGMRMYAEPPTPKRHMVPLDAMINNAVAAAREQPDIPKLLEDLDLIIRLPETPHEVYLDDELIGRAITELVLNAVQSPPRSCVKVNGKIDPNRKQLTIEVIDDGPGMNDHTLSHAMDPFFSAKAAGRRTGLGLPRARIMAASHGGRVELRSVLEKGTTASLTVPLDSHV